MNKNNILENINDVEGEIYIITNIKNSKNYIGQTRTHYKNRGKYRPYGYLGRFNSHISEALLNTKKKQCTYLNNAIRKYGKDNFIIELIETCDLSNLDNLEKFYIAKYNSVYPYGYNLTNGGNTQCIAKIENNNIACDKSSIKTKSEETKQLISKRLKELHNNTNIKEKWINNAIIQHQKNRLNKFKNVTINIDNIEHYLKPVINKNTKAISHYKVIIDGIKTNFTGNDITDCKNRAINFIKSIHMQHNQIDGNSS